MRQFFAWLFLEWKKTAKVFLLSLCGLGITAVILAGLMTAAARKLETGSLGIIKIGVIVPEDETMSRFTVDYISSMSSVKSICEFEYLPKEEALSRYRDKTLLAVVELPEGFFHDVMVGINPPAVIYFPEDTGLTGLLFRELLVTGVSYLQIAESGVYATLDVSFAEGSKMDAADIGNTVALAYADEIFVRDKFFDPVTVSAFGSLDLIPYYFLAGMTVLLSMSGLMFAGMYGKTAQAVSDKLKINGLNAFTRGCGRILVKFPFVYITGVIIYLSAILLANKGGTETVPFRGSFFLWFLVTAFTLSLYFGLIYSLAGSGKAGAFVLIILNVTGTCVSGMLIPRVYLARWTQVIGDIFPHRYWMELLCRGIYGFFGGAG